MNRKPDFEYEGIKILIRLIDKIGRRLKKISERLGFLLYKKDFGEREDDIYIATYPKSGTTLMQMILYQLTTDGSLDFKHIYEVSPWIRNASARREKPKEFPSPRVIKTHDFYNEFPKGTKGRFIFVYRDGMDVAVSLFNQNKNYNNPDLQFDVFIKKFLSGKKRSWFYYTKDWLENKKHLPVLLLTYEDLINQKEEQIRKIIQFCGLASTADQIERAIRLSSFESMKKEEEKFGVQPPVSKMVFDQFIRRGKVGEGSKMLTEEQRERFNVLFADIVSPALQKTIPENNDHLKNSIVGEDRIFMTKDQ